MIPARVMQAIRVAVADRWTGTLTLHFRDGVLRELETASKETLDSRAT